MVHLTHLVLAATLASAAPVTKREEPKYALVRITSDGPMDMLGALPQPNYEFMLIGSSVFGLLGQIIGGVIGGSMPKNTTFTRDSLMAGLASEFNAVKGAISSFTGGGAAAPPTLGGPMPGMSNASPSEASAATSTATSTSATVASSSATAAVTKSPTIPSVFAPGTIGATPNPTLPSIPAILPPGTVGATPRTPPTSIPAVLAPGTIGAIPNTPPPPAAIPTIFVLPKPAPEPIPAVPASPVVPKPAAAASPAGPTNFMQHPGHGM